MLIAAPVLAGLLALSGTAGAATAAVATPPATAWVRELPGELLPNGDRVAPVEPDRLGPDPAPRALQPWHSAQNLESTIVAPDFGRQPGLGNHPRRKPGLWEIRNAASDNLGMPPTHFCVGERTDTPENHLDRAAGEKGTCSIGAFKQVGITWVAESVCKESRSVVVSQSIASGDFQTQYRIDTLVFYSPPLANNRREDKEAIVARYLGACGAGQRPGDLMVPGMGVLNMGDGTLRQAPGR